MIHAAKQSYYHSKIQDAENQKGLFKNCKHPSASIKELSVANTYFSEGACIEILQVLRR